jgi:hypothetical protein
MERIEYAEAVRRVESALLDQTSFVVLLSADRFCTEGIHALSTLENWQVLCDMNGGLSDVGVFRTSDEVWTAVETLHTFGMEFVPIILLVSKKVPASKLNRVLNLCAEEKSVMSEDGAQDIVIATGKKGGQVSWPVIFVRAMEKVDPKWVKNLVENAVGGI